MKRISLIYTIIVLSLLIFSNGVIAKDKSKDAKKSIAVEGKVIDKETGETLVGANILVEGLQNVLTTDLDGNFVLTNIQPGEYTIKVNYISYKEEVKIIQVGDNQKSVRINIELESR